MTDTQAPTADLSKCAVCDKTYPVGTAHECLPDRTTQNKAVAQESTERVSRVRAPSVEVGQLIGGKYQILSRLSEGGMGTVYQARHVALGSLVAMKLVKSDGDTLFEQRFIQEARIASSVQHPNIVYLSDFGALPDGRSFLVMEYLQGRTLADALKEDSFDVQRACLITVQLVRGIAAVHAKGIVHRDLKPDNVFLVEQSGVADMVKIIDFGIAKRAKESSRQSAAISVMNLAPNVGQADEVETQPPGVGLEPRAIATLTQVGALIGTPGYMAPEQIRSGKVDERADQYAIGCILYKLLTGRGPFVGATSADLLAQHLIEEVPSIQSVAPTVQVSDGLQTLVSRLLDKQASRRYRSLKEVEEALLAELSTSQQRVSLNTGKIPGLRIAQDKTDQIAQVAPPPPQRRRVKIAAAAVGVVLLLGVVLYLVKRQSVPPRLTEQELLRIGQQAMEQLNEELRDADVEVRIAALSALGQSHDPLALPPLRAIYQGAGGERERAAALSAIGELGEREGVSVLQGALQDAQATVIKSAAAQALLAIGDAKGAAYFVRGLGARDPETPVKSAVLLCEHGHAQAISKLTNLLATKQVPKPLELDALTCLSRAGSPSATEQLRERLADPAAEEVALPAAARLARLGHAEGIAYLRKVEQNSESNQLRAAELLAAPYEKSGLPLFRSVAAAKEPSLANRILALHGLREAGETEDLRLLSKLFTADPAALIRLHAASTTLQILSREPEVRARRDINWARVGLSDPNWLVRHSAVPLLGKQDEAEALSLLKNALKDDKIHVRTRVVQVISRASGQEALRLLDEGLKNDHLDVREASLRAVVQVARSTQLQGGFSTAVVKKWLARLAESPTESQRAVAQAGLLQLGDGKQWLELKQLKTSKDREMRALVAYAAIDDRETLFELLSDPEPTVRRTAAQRLAQLKDKRGVEVLRQGVEAGGLEALRCGAALRGLGEELSGPAPIDRLRSSESVEERLAFVESAGNLAGAEAIELLTEAAHDPEPYVRRLTAEMVAELSAAVSMGPRLALLAHLSRDSSPMVRTRAAALLSQHLHQTKNAQTTVRTGYSTQVKRTRSPEVPVAKAEPEVELKPAPTFGELTIASAHATYFQLDGGDWQRTPVTPLTLGLGPHQMRYLAGQQSVEVISGQAVLFDLPESPAEQLTRTGREALEKKDYRRAQKLLDKSTSSCPGSSIYALPCRSLLAEAAYHLGASYEAQEQWAEAVTEYQRVAKTTEVHGRVDYWVEAQAAIARLLPRVGRVIIPQQKRKSCTEVTMWMTAGRHEVLIGGKKVPVMVRPGSVALAGECPNDE